MLQFSQIMKPHFAVKVTQNSNASQEKRKFMNSRPLFYGFLALLFGLTLSRLLFAGEILYIVRIKILKTLYTPRARLSNKSRLPAKFYRASASSRSRMRGAHIVSSASSSSNPRPRSRRRRSSSLRLARCLL